MCSNLKEKRIAVACVHAYNHQERSIKSYPLCFTEVFSDFEGIVAYDEEKLTITYLKESIEYTLKDI